VYLHQRLNCQTINAKRSVIDYHELKVAMRALGFDMKKAEVLDILRENDPKGSGLMDWPAFNRIST